MRNIVVVAILYELSTRCALFKLVGSSLSHDGLDLGLHGSKYFCVILALVEPHAGGTLLRKDGTVFE